MPVSKNIQESKHLSFTYFQSLIKNELTQSQIRENEPHLKKCDRCRELSDVLMYARKTAARQPKVKTHTHPKKADLTEAIAKLMVEASSAKEAANLIGHLSSCSRCFNYIESFFEEALSPLGENVEDELRMYAGISIAEQALAMRPPKSSWLAQLKDWIKKIIPEPLPKWSYAAVGATMCIVFALGGTRYYQIIYRLNLSAKILKENHRIFIEQTPRPSGGYAASGISILMAPDTTSYLTQALELTKKALDSGADKGNSQRLLARIFIFQNQLERADSVFNRMDAAVQNSADVLNDRGVLEFQRQNWSVAANYFEAAIRADSTFAEAYYNLALALSKENQKPEAIALLNEFLKIEKDEGWKNAAQELIEQLSM